MSEKTRDWESLTPDDAWQSLTQHLAEPIKARIFFELMFHDNAELTIADLQWYTAKRRTTINHHLENLLSDGILEVSKSDQHKRGKPTRHFRLQSQFLALLKTSLPTSYPIDKAKSDMKRQASFLHMLGNIADQSHNLIANFTENYTDEIDVMVAMPHPFYIFNVGTSAEAEIYTKHIAKALANARTEIENREEGSSNKQETKINLVVFAGFTPVLYPTK